MRKYYFIVLAPMCFMLAFLPVSLNAAGPPPVNANVINTPNVNIVNPEASPVPIKNVENPAKSAYVKSCTAHIPVNLANLLCDIFVPDGKRIFIEFVDVICTNLSGNPDTFPTIFIHLPHRGPKYDESYNPLLFALEYIPSNNTYTANRTVNLFADPTPSWPVKLNFYHTATGDQARCTGVVSGYLVDLP